MGARANQNRELRSLASGLAPVSTEEVGDYQRKVGRIHELVDRIELGETLLLRDLRLRVSSFHALKREKPCRQRRLIGSFSIHTRMIAFAVACHHGLSHSRSTVAETATKTGNQIQ